MAKRLKNLPNSPDNVAAQDRRIQVLNYRIQHQSLRAIAKKLNVSHQTVKNDLDKAMEELHKTETQRTADYRMMELQRLEVACSAIMRKVVEGDISAVDEYRKLSESRRKLLGLDGPVSVKLDAEVADNVSAEVKVGAEMANVFKEQGIGVIHSATMHDIPKFSNAYGKSLEAINEALKEKLKDSGLGTPATRAAIIERLLSVGYIERKAKSLIPTEKGIRLINIVPSELRSPETTGKWERGLSRISKGEMDASRFMDSIVRYVRYIVDESSKPKPTY